MSSSYSGTPKHIKTFTIPADGDADSAATFNTTFQAMIDTIAGILDRGSPSGAAQMTDSDAGFASGLTAIVYDSDTSLFHITAADGNIRSSADGSSFSLDLAGAAAYNAVASSQGDSSEKLIAVGAGVEARNTGSWAETTGNFGGATMRGVAYGDENSIYLAVGADANAWISSGGWTSAAALGSSAWYDVCWASTGASTGRYIAVGDNGAIYRITADGATGTDESVATAEDFRAVAFGENAGDEGEDVILAVGTSGTIAYSEDAGLTWTLGSLNTSKDLLGVVFDQRIGWVVVTADVAEIWIGRYHDGTFRKVDDITIGGTNTDLVGVATIDESSRFGKIVAIGDPSSGNDRVVTSKLF